jgi:hypothetical protein
LAFVDQAPSEEQAKSGGAGKRIGEFSGETKKDLFPVLPDHRELMGSVNTAALTRPRTQIENQRPVSPHFSATLA